MFEVLGGLGLSCFDVILVFEVLLMFCVLVVVFLLIYNMVVVMIDCYGLDEMKVCILFGVLMMEIVLSYCLIEFGLGLDVVALCICVVCYNDGWYLIGIKVFILGGGYLDVYVVMVCLSDDSLCGILVFFVEVGVLGLFFGGLEDKMGWCL